MGKRDGEVKQKKETNDACFMMGLVKIQGKKGDSEYRSSQEAQGGQAGALSWSTSRMAIMLVALHKGLQTLSFLRRVRGKG